MANTGTNSVLAAANAQASSHTADLLRELLSERNIANGHLHELTSKMHEHPRGYEGPCNCLECRTLDAEPDEAPAN